MKIHGYNLAFFLFIFSLFFDILCVFFTTDYEAVVKLSDGFNGADLRNVCTEAGKGFIMICFHSAVQFNAKTLQLSHSFVGGFWEGFHVRL